MATFNSADDLRVEANLRKLAEMIFALYTWAGGPSFPIGRLLASGEIGPTQAEQYLKDALSKSSGSTGPPPLSLIGTVSVKVVAAATAYSQSLVDAEAARQAAIREAQRLAAEQEAARVAASVYPVLPSPVQAIIAPSPVQAIIAPMMPTAPTLPLPVAPMLAPTVAPMAREVPMGMLQSVLGAGKEVAGALGGAIAEVAKAVAPAIPAVAAQSFLPQLAGTAARVLTGPAGRAAAAGAAGALGAEWLFGESGTVAFRERAATATPERFIMREHPYTGRMHYWEHVGRPVLFSRDLAACKRVNKIAARAARARGRRGNSAMVRRRKRA